VNKMEHLSITKALAKKVGLEVVSMTNTDQQLRVLGRVHPNLLHDWLLVMQWLLTKSETTDWKIDLSKQYFLRGQKLLYGWRIIIQSENLSKHYSDIVSTIMSVPSPVKELDEVPLAAPPNRNALSGTGKGAQPTMSAVVGPMARAQIRAGGS